jgi:hypothetical protein
VASYTSGELVWETTEATAPHWVLLIDGPPGSPKRRLDPHDRATRQGASTSQLRALISRAWHEDTGQWPVSVTVAVVRAKQRFRFHVVTY